MKAIQYRNSMKVLLLTTTLLSLSVVARGAENKSALATKPAKAPVAATNAVPVVAEIPKSVFVIPTNPQEGKDPFFPKSTRLFNTVVVATAVTSAKPAAAIPSDLQLKGISGVAERRLAIIGSRTFEKGEERELPTSAGRVRIRCLDITTDSVLIQIGDEQRILRLRPGI